MCYYTNIWGHLATNIVKWKENTLKEKYQSMDNTKNRERKRKLLPKNEEISGRKAHTNTQKLNWNVSMITDVFLDHKRLNVCKHTVKTTPIGRSHLQTYYLYVDWGPQWAQNIYFCKECLKMPKIYEETSLPFISMSCPLFIPIFMISVLPFSVKKEMSYS